MKKTMLLSLVGMAAVTGKILTQYKPLGRKPKTLQSPNRINGKFLDTPTIETVGFRSACASAVHFCFAQAFR